MSRYNTPLRYPGGKQKLAPFIVELMTENGLIGGEYVEPYAGGAGIAMNLLLSAHVRHVHLNDSCKRVYSFWRSVLTKPEELCRLISRASLTIDEWKRQREVFRAPSKHTQLEVGFSTFYLNRCNRSGILSGGVIGGLAQKGDWKLDARFPRNELIRRIEAIAVHAKSITLKNMDAERFITEYLPKVANDSLIYLDPPYVNKADRLYMNHYDLEDHARIAKLVQRKIRQPWIVSYDNTKEIMNAYSGRRYCLYNLRYTASTSYTGTELIFFCDKLIVPHSSRVPGIDAGLRRLSDIDANQVARY